MSKSDTRRFGAIYKDSGNRTISHEFTSQYFSDWEASVADAYAQAKRFAVAINIKYSLSPYKRNSDFALVAFVPLNPPK